MDERLHHVSSRASSASPVSKLVAGIIGALIIAIVGFVAGINYQKGHASSTAASTASGRTGMYGRRFGGARNGGRGQVTAISATSITINDQRTGASKTYAITSNTKITDNGSAVTTSDIQTGEAVWVMTSSATSTDATAILVNPSMMGPGASQPSATPTSAAPTGASI